MRLFLIEVFNVADHSSTIFIAKAKDYDHAVSKVANYGGEAQFKLLGMFEQLETEKILYQRIS